MKYKLRDFKYTTNKLKLNEYSQTGQIQVKHTEKIKHIKKFINYD